MITFDQVSKRRGPRCVLNDVSFTAREGRVTAVLGPNGAGKSTAIRVLLGLDRPDEGTALITGQHYRELGWPLRTVGALLDGAGTHPARTARGHLSWVAASNRLARQRIGEVLDLVGLSAVARQRVGTFSLGMRQRLGLASALLGAPTILVLDEPFNGLDPDGIRWVSELVRNHADRGGTVLLSSHLLGETATIADDLVFMASGRIAGTGTVNEIMARYRSIGAAYFELIGPQR
jgi:ABC-2 type transport system ATP-binding protein